MSPARGSPLPPQKASRKVRKVRKVFFYHKEHKEMKGGNGVREANGITQFAEGEPKRSKCANQIDAAENLLWM